MVTVKPTVQSEAPAVVTIITREDITLSGARDLIDALRMVPGFDFGVDIWNVVGAGFRGLWGQEGKILLTVDGMGFNEYMYGNIPFGNHFPLELVEKIEIIRGPGSASLLARWPDCPLSFAPLDIDRPFAEGGVAPGTYSLVYGVNVLHVARDLAATLRELRVALKVGGVMVMSECVRPLADTPLHMEFVFNLLAAFRDPLLVPTWRPNGGFLTPEQWASALAANGFEGIRIYPDIAAIRGAYPSFVAAAIVARKT